MSTPTEIQQKLYHFITGYMTKEQRPPSYDEMGKAVGLKSRSNVKYHLDALEEHGYVERARGARGIRLLRETPGVVRIPLRGTIAASPPVLCEQVEEAIHLTRSILPDLDTLYALRVKGDSMKDAQVNDGDIVVLNHQNHANDGDMVAVRLTDRDEYTLKHFHREREPDRVRLAPANPDYDDILVHPAVVEIQGRVVTVIRQYP